MYSERMAEGTLDKVRSWFKPKEPDYSNSQARPITPEEWKQREHDALRDFNHASEDDKADVGAESIETMARARAAIKREERKGHVRRTLPRLAAGVLAMGGTTAGIVAGAAGDTVPPIVDTMERVGYEKDQVIKAAEEAYMDLVGNKHQKAARKTMKETPEEVKKFIVKDHPDFTSNGGVLNTRRVPNVPEHAPSVGVVGSLTPGTVVEGVRVNGVNAKGDPDSTEWIAYPGDVLGGGMDFANATYLDEVKPTANHAT